MLEIQNIRAAYSRTEVLHGVSASFKPGKLTAIIGPNGCGKSTLLKCIGNLIKPSGGHILLNGNNLQTFTDRERAKYISYMPQNRTVPEISVQQLVAHGRYPHLSWGQSLRSNDQLIIDDAIARVHLTALRTRPVSQLSGGERQRAYIAMMLAQQTPVMLLDEPTAFLDISARFELMALMQTLSSEGRCILIVLHELSLALECCDNLLLMQDGTAAESGDSEAVYAGGKLQEVFGVGVQRSADGKYILSPAPNVFR